MKRFSWYLNKVWNLGHNNEDADFDWWEWYSWHPVKRYWKRRMGKYIKELAGSPDSLISLGCGSSPVINFFGSRVVGIDLEASKMDFMKTHSAATFITGDVTQDLGLGKFQVVLCNEVLEHLGGSDLTEVVRLLTSYLEKDGLLVISFPDYGSWYGKILERLFHGTLHTKEFTREDLLEVCRLGGLKLVEERKFLWDTVMSFRREGLVLGY